MKAIALPIPGNLAQRMLWLLAGIGLLLCLVAPVHAQSEDPPARVARVADVLGSAWLYDSENREWTPLLRNQSVGEGDHLRTDDHSRVALRIGSTSLWVDERSDLSFPRLDEGRVQLQVDKGDIGLRIRSNEAAADYRVQTREGAMIPERDGFYRVEQLDDDRGSRGYVWQGRLRFEPARGGSPSWLEYGEQAEFWWAGGPRMELSRLSSDSFGDWMVAQNQRDDEAVAQRYVSPEMTGAEDLDRNGSWAQAGEYGAVWIPYQVAPDWVPYQYGRWVWTRNWGWSWVDDQPWGFAPFHYGRWVQWGGRWCWAPGAYVARPVYAPAMVAWVGGGSVNVGISVGGGRPPPPRYGWYPLAPREVYVPPYRHSSIYVQRVNSGFPAGPASGNRPAYSNRNIAGAVSYMPGQGGPARPMPAAEVRSARPLPPTSAAPARADLAGLQPARPAPEMRPSADLGWRSDNRGRQDRPDRDQARSAAPPAQVQAPAQSPPGMRVDRQEPVQQPGNPARRDNMMWRDRDRSATPAAPAAPVVTVPERQVERPVERQPDRQADRQPEHPQERQFERPRAAEPAPAPAQVQAAPPAARPQPPAQARGEDKDRRGRNANKDQEH